MSVINKMLRDLDARNQIDGSTTHGMQDSSGTATASRGVTALPAVPRANPTPRLLLAAVAVILLAATMWWWLRSAPVPESRPAPPAPNMLSQPPVSNAVEAQTPTAPHAPASAPAPATQSTVLPKSATKAPAPVQRAPQTNVMPVTPPIAPSKVATAAAIKPAAPTPVPSGASSGAVSSAVAAPAIAVEPTVTGSRQLQAGREALLQAQVLWNSGSRDAAMDLLQQALSVVERSITAPAGQTQTALMASLARELGRMLVAAGRPAAAIDLLSRLEPTLGREADIWALRGNAAQRLGRNQDSVNAYAKALQLRPNEQRWMLASAVSLAAMGQTANATEMTTKASALGPVGKEVLAYLRQAGVRLGEP